MQMWPITPYVAAPTFKKEEEPSSETSTIPLRRNHRRRVHSRSTIEEDEEFDELDQPSQQDASKLKGVLWPGMNMFDSATPDMRRKRNQKKATSVVEHLETMSQTVEATELIFSPSGSLRRARTISGQPDSDSEPLKGEDTPPKKRRASSQSSVVSCHLCKADCNQGERPIVALLQRGIPTRPRARDHAASAISPCSMALLSRTMARNKATMT